MRNSTKLSVFRMLHAGLLAALLIAAAACGSANVADGNTAPANTNAGANQAAEGDPASANAGGETGTAPAETAYPLTVKDVTGTEIVLEKAPAKIVSIAPSETEIVYAIGAGDKVVGVDTNSNYPPETANVSKVGDFKTDIEAVAALAPDLVLANAAMNADAIEALRQLKINVFASDPKTFDDTAAHIEEIGLLTNNGAKAGEVADGMRAVKQEIADKVKDAPKKKVYVEFSPGWTVGGGEFLDELVTLAGGINVANGKPGWYEVDAEAVLKANPEVIVYPDFGDDKTIPEAIAARPGWNGIDAVRNNRVVAVANDPLVRVGPRLSDGLRELAKAIHPDLFA